MTVEAAGCYTTQDGVSGRVYLCGALEAFDPASATPVGTFHCETMGYHTVALDGAYPASEIAACAEDLIDRRLVVRLSGRLLSLANPANRS